MRTETKNAYTADRTARLRGDAMQFDPSVEDEGIFFVAVSDETVARAEYYSRVG